MTSTEQNNAAPLESLIERMASGDRQALASLYGETKTAVYGYALSILKNAHDAEDVLHDTYVRLWNASGSYSPCGKPMAWILTTTKNLAISLLRKDTRCSTLPEEQWQLFYAESPSLTPEDRLTLEAALNGLNESERQTVMLHAVAGLKHSETAELLGMPLSTVLSKYSRAIKKLRQLLKEEN